MDVRRHEPRPLPLFLQLLLQHGGHDGVFVRRVLDGLRTYQTAERIPRPDAMPEIARAGRARVLDYGTAGRPVLFVPSLINPPYVLDLAADNSLLRWLAGQGFRPFLVDWGDPRDGQSRLSVAEHIETMLLPLIDTVGSDAVLAGYCLGGTMSMAVAAQRRLAGLILIASPWSFAGYPAAERIELRALWDRHAPDAQALELFPMEMLQSAFWHLDPVRTLAKFAEFGAMDPQSPEAKAFIALEDWANEGPPLTVAAARELFEDMLDTDLPGRGKWRVGDCVVDPAAITCPVLNIVSSTDRIVPAATAPILGEQVVLDHGHVGMVVGRQAKSGLWQALASWLSQLRHS